MTVVYPKSFEVWYAGIINPVIEGGISNRKKEEDPGGLTFRGLTFTNFGKFAMPDLGIEPTKENFLKLTDEQLKKIFYKRYFLAGNVGKAKNQYQIVVMDSVFHGGGIPSLSPKDSKGKSTFSTVEELNKSGLTVNDLVANRDKYLKGLKNYESNKNGWAKRLKELIILSQKVTPAIAIPFILLILIVFLTLFN